ncbi:MAG TPA: CRISPR-associated protein Cas4 [Bacteroidia bacterium]|nr:CRISPR-associated protein Cas4 [Bacteroidia bacterium]
MSFPEDQLVPISALQHWLYCPRQCALIHLEQLWAENRYTAEGRVLHEKAHDGRDETRAGVRIARGLSVRSLELGLTGQCDVVEFHRTRNGAGCERIVPVEYKRGKPKAHRADEVQLCAQAMCLEEMLGLPEGSVGEGCLFYGTPRRRTGVVFDEGLRALTKETVSAVQEMRGAGTTPTAEYLPKRCDACSLVELCQPKALRFRRGAAAWFERNLDLPFER